MRLLLVNLLIKAGADINEGDVYGETVLHYAVRLGREDLLTVLLKAGAGVNAVGGRKKVCSNSLHILVMHQLVIMFLYCSFQRTPYELAKHEKRDRMAFQLKRVKDLYDWLDEIGMEEYKTTFLKEEMYKDVASDLDYVTLDKLGVRRANHRLKFLKAAKALQAQKKQISTDMSPSESVAVLPVVAKPIEQEVENLKHITKQGNWDIQYYDLEFTVKLGSSASGTSLP